jgi:choline kinase
MNAILYVAGRASRLGEITATRNKVLLEFGGKSLLERHVMLLEKLGIKKLYVVTGHLREVLTGEMAGLEGKYSVELEEIFNRDFAEGSVLSMQASLPVLKTITDEVLLMDGDVLYDGRMLRRLVVSGHRTALLVDREYSTTDDDPVLVPLKQGRPFEFVKKWQGEADMVGESVGFFKVHARDLPVLIEETEARAQGEARKESYDEVLRAMVKQGLFGAEDVTGLPWTEIDFPHDLDYAAKVIMPALQE